MIRIEYNSPVFLIVVGVAGLLFMAMFLFLWGLGLSNHHTSQQLEWEVSQAYHSGQASVQPPLPPGMVVNPVTQAPDQPIPRQPVKVATKPSPVITPQPPARPAVQPPSRAIKPPPVSQRPTPPTIQPQAIQPTPLPRRVAKAHIPRTTQAQQVDAQLNRLLTQLGNELALLGIGSWTNRESGVLYLPGVFDFTPRTTTFNPEQSAVLGQLADILAKILPCYVSSAAYVGSPTGCEKSDSPVHLATVVIDGHSIAAEPGSKRFQANWRLAAERARETFLNLLAHQPALDHFRNPEGRSLFRIGGYAASKRGEAFSRRVELRFIMATDEKN
ncbi:MAG: hypothetical protein HQL52_10035 [Magnetococcales bacterium]|nr:hypothetical protein [Magnetococcales bacterium]